MSSERHSVIELCDTEMLFTSIEKGIQHRFRVFGMAEQCRVCDCQARCAQANNPHNNTAFECWKHPGPLTVGYWARRHRQKTTQTGVGRVEIHRVKEVRVGIGPSRKQSQQGVSLPGNAPAVSPPSIGKEVSDDTM